MNVEEEYEDVLMNIEMNLVTSYDDLEMTDAQALNAVNGLIRTYKAEQKKRSAPKLKLSPLAEETFDRLHVFCDLLIGKDMPDAELVGDKRTVKKMKKLFVKHQVSLEVMLACLKRIEKSIKLWNKEGGRRGYYSYVSQFLP